MIPIRSCCALLLLLSGLARAPAQEPPAREPTAAQQSAEIDPIVTRLVELQEEGGEWPYEGRYRIDGEIPVAYRVGGTSLVCLALLHSGRRQDREVDAAFQAGLDSVLGHLDHEQLKSARVDRYDMRVVGQAYALLFLCHVHAAKAGGGDRSSIERWISKLAKALAHEQMPDGGWNYQGRPVHAAFVTASVVQALLWARGEGAKIPKKVFRRAKEALELSRIPDGAYYYFGTSRSAKERQKQDLLPGSAGRSPICESMLFLLGGSTRERIQGSIDAFHQHWDELEKRRKKSGTHEGPYLIAPYYFYYGHRYAAQAVELLAEGDRPRERRRLRALIQRTRDEDGTWNDREFPRSKSYGTAMILLSLSSEQVGLPPACHVK